jgi:hypothetical protein
MIDQHSALMITVLRRDYPEIAESISEKISRSMPEQTLEDLSMIEQIVISFKKEKGIEHHSWTWRKSQVSITRDRELLLAVVLLFYHPEKIIYHAPVRVKNGIIQTLSDNLGTSRVILSQTIPSTTIAFRVYEDFRTEVYRLYELIKTENQFF